MEVVPAASRTETFDLSKGLVRYGGVECVVYTFELSREPWFDSRPIAEILGLDNIRKNVADLDDDVKARYGELKERFGPPITTNGLYDSHARR